MCVVLTTTQRGGGNKMYIRGHFMEDDSVNSYYIVDVNIAKLNCKNQDVMDKEDNRRHNAFRKERNQQIEVCMNNNTERNIRSSKNTAKNSIGEGQAKQETGDQKEKQKSKGKQGESDKTVVKIFNRNKVTREKAKRGKKVKKRGKLN